MAANILKALKLGQVSSLSFNLVKNSTVNAGVRTLYTQSSLAMDSFLDTREKIKAQFSGMADKFRAKMNQYAVEGTESMIFTEDLKNMIHLAETPDDIPLVMNMIKKFNSQNKELRFGSFKFGPVVMRMFHLLNAPDEALECFQSAEMSGFFDQIMSYHILMDLLYENGRYDDVVSTFEAITSKQIENMRYPKNLVVLVLAACYKKNDPESLKYALKLWNKLLEVGHLPMRKAVTFCAGLALRQGNPQATIELISGVKNQHYVTVRNLKVVSLAEVGRIEDALALLKNVLEMDEPSGFKHTFNVDVIERVKAVVEKQQSEELKANFAKIEKYLVAEGKVSHETLDQQLCSEVVSLPMSKRTDGEQANRNFRSSPRQQYRVHMRRPGLTDMQ